MEVRLLVEGYKTSETLYQDFLADKINEKEDYFSNETVYIREAPDFPIYIAKGSEEEKKQKFLQAFKVISQSYLTTERDVILDEKFWHSLLLTQKQNFILTNYPEVEKSKSIFHNIVLKKFDWENYIYKTILGAQYVNDNFSDENERQRYYELIIENLDLYNYIIKYEIFRNDKFLINILSIIDELKLSKTLKAKIKGREDLGDDERVGRRVIFEFNKSYPVVMSPLLEKEELKEMFMEYLSYYHNASKVVAGKETETDASREVDTITQRTDYKPSPQEEKSLQTSDSLFAGNEGSTSIYDETKSLLNRISKQIKSNTKSGNEKIETEGQTNLIAYFEKNKLEYVDHRSKGGSLWVIGDKNIESYLRPLEGENAKFKYRPIGSKASKNRPAWFWYSK